MINIGKGYSWVTVLVLQLFCCCENLQNMNLGIKEMNIASGRYNEEIWWGVFTNTLAEFTQFRTS